MGGRGPNFLNQPFIIGAILLVVALAAVLVWFALRDGGESEQATGDVATLDQALADLPKEVQRGNTLGSDDAPLKLEVFEDFQCPFCLRFTVDIEPFLVEEYVKAGLLQIKFRHLPVVGLESPRAAVGASCAAEQDRMFEYNNRLFAAQAADDFSADDGVFAEDNLVTIAGDLGLDTEAFADCQARPDALSPVSGDTALAQSLGFRGTPSYLLNGLPVNAPPSSTDGWATLLDDLLETIQQEDEAADEEAEPDAADTPADETDSADGEDEGAADTAEDDGS